MQRIGSDAGSKSLPHGEVPRCPRRGGLAAAAAAFPLILLASALDRANAGPDAAPLVTAITSPADGAHQAWNTQLRYRASVTYRGRSSSFGELPANDVAVEARFVPDTAAAARLDRQLPAALAAISQSNCTGCHDFQASGAGPSYAAVAQRYAKRPGAAALLAAHIRNGSHGVWGAAAMPPHPDLGAGQAEAIAGWILGHAAEPGVAYAIGSEGSIRMAGQGHPGPHAGTVLTAYYTGALAAGDSNRSAGPRSRVTVLGAPGS